MVGSFFSLILLIKNLLFYWLFSYAFYPDSNLYVQLGASLFKTWYVTPIVTIPYPFLNALTHSSSSPVLLMWVQILFGSVVGGFFIFVITQKNQILAVFLGLLFIFDFVWGGWTRSLMTDGIFSAFLILGLSLFLLHYFRRDELPAWELFLSGILYGLIIFIRPSHIFLAILFPPIYLWLTKSWKKMLVISCGLVFFFAIIGLTNLKGTKRFYILSNNESYTSNFLAYPLFIYKLFSPDNGPTSRMLDGYLQTCYPGLSYAESVDRSEGMGFSTENNMDFIQNKVYPCVQAYTNDQTLFRTAYIESLTSKPVKFFQTMTQEVAIFLRYGNPYVLRWILNASNNYGCTDFLWCETLNQSRSSWDYRQPLIGIYEKISTKILQIYLAPIGILSRLFPEKQYLPVLTSWIAIFGFLILFTRSWERLLILATGGLVLYTAVIVVVGLGFTERYAAMLSPVQTIFSGIAWFVVFRIIFAACLKILRKTSH